MSMFPHTVTVYTITEDNDTLEVFSNITVIRGVLLDASKGANVRTSGLEGADSVNLYIPFDAVSVDGVTGKEKAYIQPKAYEAALDKTDIWTMDPGNSFFVKGEVVNPDLNFQEINVKYDNVHMITKVDTKDFGKLAHFEVGGS